MNPIREELAQFRKQLEQKISIPYNGQQIQIDADLLPVLRRINLETVNLNGTVQVIKKAQTTFEKIREQLDHPDPKNAKVEAELLATRKIRLELEDRQKLAEALEQSAYEERLQKIDLLKQKILEQEIRHAAEFDRLDKLADGLAIFTRLESARLKR